VFTRIVSSGLWDWSTETAFYVSNTTLTAVNAAQGCSTLTARLD
jgi:hypothetical protein